MKKTLKEIADWLGIDSGKYSDEVVTGISIDTRTLKKVIYLFLSAVKR